MKQRTVSSRLCFSRDRLDSHYYVAPGVAARDRIESARQSGISTREVGGNAGVAHVWQPSRFKRAYAATGEPSVPYLRPYDVFEYLPTAADWLSVGRTENLPDYQLRPGTILQTCSGRNLGPASMADEYLTGFALSHDIIRIDVHEPQLRSYLYAFLSTPTGQAILRQNMSGSVVDHLTTEDVATLDFPLLNDGDREHVICLAAQSLQLVNTARLELRRLVDDYQARFARPSRGRPRRKGWAVGAQQLSDRLDAAFYDPIAASARQQLTSAGGGPCGDVATSILPGRYKRYYVSPVHGRPILSGTHLLQYDPINLRYISDRSFRNPAEMVLHTGMVCFGADGRWEGRLGQPAYVTSDRDGWLASNHVMRLNPKAHVEPGWLWIAFTTEQVQDQIAALPYGSVVDSIRPEDVARVVLPPYDPSLGDRVTRTWEMFVDARRLRQQALEAMEDRLDAVAGDVPVPA